MLMSASLHYEHLHTILYNPFLSVSVSGSVNTQEWPWNQMCLQIYGTDRQL